MRSKTLLLAFVLGCGLAGAALAQPLGTGIKLGVPATDAFDVVPIPTFSPFNADQRPFVFGPYLELRLPAKLAIELDALYRSFSFRTQAGNESGGAWEFPLLLKYRTRNGLVRPYLEGGASFNRLTDIKFSAIKNRTAAGFVLGGGIEFNALLIKIAPEIRYTRYGRPNFEGGTLESNQNQLTVLLGIGF